MKPRAQNSAEAEFVLIMMLKMPWSRAGTAGPALVISHPEAVAICSGHSVSGEGKKKGGVMKNTWNGVLLLIICLASLASLLVFLESVLFL